MRQPPTIPDDVMVWLNKLSEAMDAFVKGNPSPTGYNTPLVKFSRVQFLTDFGVVEQRGLVITGEIELIKSAQPTAL